LSVVKELFAVETGIGLKQIGHREAIAIHAKDLPVLVLLRLVIPIIPATQAEEKAKSFE
jgi:hypothetical protein